MYTPSFLTKHLDSLRLEFAEPIFYVPAGAEVKMFDPQQTAAADSMIRSCGLLASLDFHIQALRSKAPSPCHIEGALSGIDQTTFDRLMLVHTLGSDRFTLGGWTPNGGIGFRQSTTVIDNASIVEHKLQLYWKRVFAWFVLLTPSPHPTLNSFTSIVSFWCRSPMIPQAVFASTPQTAPSGIRH